MTASYAPEDELLGLVPAIRSGVEEAAELVNGIIGGVDSVLRELPPELVGGVRDGVDDLRRLFDDTIGQLRRVLDQAGDPAALRAAGAAWAVDIGGGASSLSGLAVEASIRADNHWTGPAADAYSDALLPQRLALNAVKTTGDAIDAVLTDLARAIVDFWKDLEAALLTLVVSLAVALAAATGTITLGVALGIAASALVVFRDALISQITMVTDLANECSVRTAELNHRIADGTGFDGGSWPNPTADDLSDGSVTDGDDTDWHIR